MRCASYAKYASCIPEKEIPSDGRNTVSWKDFGKANKV